MAHSLSSKKRVRQNEKHRARNQGRKSVLKTQTRKFTDALADKDVAVAEQEFNRLTKELGQVASQKTIHANRAARIRSRMQKKLNALKAASG